MTQLQTTGAMASDTRLPSLNLLQFLTRILSIVSIVTLLTPLPCAALTGLSDDDLRNLPSPDDDDFDIHKGKLLAPILIPRVSGTEGSFRVQQHFVDYFSEELPEWKLEWENSTSKTPVTGDKDIPFSNLIFRRAPDWAEPGDVSYLTLTAHYDSKYDPAGFIGAHDSAAPCAMLMYIAKTLEESLKAKWDAMEKSGEADTLLEPPEGVQIIFFDGEEAFRTWTATDSLYGSRSLAESWESTFHPSVSAFRTPLHSISLFVLLDLLGAADPAVRSFFLTTHWAYQNLASLETRMRSLSLLASKPKLNFLPDADKRPSSFGRSGVSDDHLPFMQRGVEILHLITVPFPATWHTMDDDGEHLDLPSVKDWAKLVTAFTAEWMDLKDWLPKRATMREKRSGTESTASKRTEL